MSDEILKKTRYTLYITKYNKSGRLIINEEINGYNLFALTQIALQFTDDFHIDIVDNKITN